MYYALVYYPRIENEAFHSFRSKYDPWHFLMPPHVPFVFPTPIEIGRENLENHISSVLTRWEKFQVHFCTVEKTFDHWMFLGALEGKQTIIQLHDELYTGILAPFLRTDLPFDPHIGLGVFSEQDYDFNNPTIEMNADIEKYNAAIIEFQSIHFEITCMIDQLVLVEIDRSFTKCSNLQSFNLTSSTY